MEKRKKKVYKVKKVNKANSRTPEEIALEWQDKKAHSDVLGWYTGNTEWDDMPEQDADDL